MKLYIAGPMRGYPRFNFPAFDAAATELTKMGHEVFSPAQRDRDEDGFDPTGLTGWEDLARRGFSLRAALKADTAWICDHAEAVVVLQGWEKSAGARAEVALARALGLPVLAIWAGLRADTIELQAVPDV